MFGEADPLSVLKLVISISSPLALTSGDKKNHVKSSHLCGAAGLEGRDAKKEENPLGDQGVL